MSVRRSLVSKESSVSTTLALSPVLHAPPACWEMGQPVQVKLSILFIRTCRTSHTNRSHIKTLLSEHFVVYNHLLEAVTFVPTLLVIICIQPTQNS